MISNQILLISKIIKSGKSEFRQHHELEARATEIPPLSLTLQTLNRIHGGGSDGLIAYGQ